MRPTSWADSAATSSSSCAPTATSTRSRPSRPRITDALATPLSLRHGTIAIRASIGIATADGHGTRVDALIAAADTAMYVAKRNGDGRPIAYDPAQHAPAV